jgi:hypothetical protein
MAALVMTALLLAGCAEPILDSGYDPVFPELPPAWTEILGPPSWRIEWISPQGSREMRETASPQGIPGKIQLPVSGASPVLAWPFWPALNILPGDFRPAGAIFPFDVSDDRIFLSWEGGVAAFFFHALAEAAGPGGAASRRPENFNWPRFRELFQDQSLKESFRADPWTADWKLVARDTVEGGFEKRRLVSVSRDELTVPVHPGPWINSSPFPPPLFFGKSPPVFPVRPGTVPDTGYSAAGILRCAGNSWIYLPREP